jgi:hypothetical protein
MCNGTPAFRSIDCSKTAKVLFRLPACDDDFDLRARQVPGGLGLSVAQRKQSGHNYVRSVQPVGYRSTAAICGSEGLLRITEEHGSQPKGFPSGVGQRGSRDITSSHGEREPYVDESCRFTDASDSRWYTHIALKYSTVLLFKGLLMPDVRVYLSDSHGGGSTI